jgi:hypothetical protein
MNPASSNASTPGGKALNVSSSHSPLQQQQNQVISPNFESNSRRFAGHSTPSHSSASPRNNQGSRKQHKNSKKPRLADEDAMAESVRQPHFDGITKSQGNDISMPTTLKTRLTQSGSHAKCQQPAGPDLHHSPHELHPPPSTTRLPKYLRTGHKEG